MKKILIISSNRLGDSILTSGLINYYKQTYKMSNITFVCGNLPAEIFKYAKNINKIISLKKRKNSLHWIILWLEIFNNFWDEVIDLRGTALSYFLFAKKRTINPFFDKNKKKKIHKVISISKFYNYDTIEPNVDLKIKQIPHFNKYFLSKDYKNFVAIAPGANWKPKQWPKEYFVELIKKLIKNKIFYYSRFILIGSSNERSIGKYITNYFEKDTIINLVGIPSLIEVCSILKKCNLFIGNDSGLMHLSASLEIPTVGLFGPSDIEQYRPWGKFTLGIKTPESPSELMGKKNFSHKNNFSLMKTLSVSNVEKKIISFYKKNVKKK